jgi:hypothetical protein
VYVPDELWERVRETRGKTNNSQLIQRALEQMANEQQAQRAAFAAGAIRDDARVSAVVARLREHARTEFEEGYSAGLELAEAIEFLDLRVVVNAGGLEAGGLEYLYHGGDESDPGHAWAHRYGGAFADIDVVEDWTAPNEPWRAGAEQAINDVWQALRANSWGTARAETENTIGGEAGVREGDENGVESE